MLYDHLGNPIALQVQSATANKPGSAGTEIIAGEFDYEKTRQLEGDQRWETYDQMEGDAHVKEKLRNAALPLTTADWRFQPHGDDTRSQEVAALLNANLLGISSDEFGFGPDFFTQTPWKAQRLPEILTMLKNGFALFMTTTKLAGLKRVYDRIQFLEPETLEDASRSWDIDDTDNIQGIHRTLLTPDGMSITNEFIPARRLKVYAWDMYGARYEGRSFIRSMFGAWFRKDFMLKRQLLWAQKVGAPVPLGRYPSSPSFTEDDKENFDGLVKAMTGTNADIAWGTFPFNPDNPDALPDIKYIGAEAEQVDRMGSLIDLENREIAHAGSGKTMSLGEGGSSGNRALGEVQGGIESLTNDALVEIVTTWMTWGMANLTGEAAELVMWNYGEETPIPLLQCVKVDPLAGKRDSGQFIQAMAAGLIPKTPGIARQFLERHGYEIDDEDEFNEFFESKDQMRDELRKRVGNVGGDGGDADEDTSKDDDEARKKKPPPGTDDDDQQVAAAAKAADAFRQKVSHLLIPLEDAPRQGGGFRAPNKLETEFVSLAEVSKALVDGEAQTRVVLRRTWVVMTEELVARQTKGLVTERTVETQRLSKFKHKKQASKRLAPVFDEVSETGAEQSDDELERQAEA